MVEKNRIKFDLYFVSLIEKLFIFFFVDYERTNLVGRVDLYTISS